MLFFSINTYRFSNAYAYFLRELRQDGALQKNPGGLWGGRPDWERDAKGSLPFQERDTGIFITTS